MKKGKVKWYNEVKGFGFIATESGERKVFLLSM
jgi:cold shock CspA family protein